MHSLIETFRRQIGIESQAPIIALLLLSAACVVVGFADHGFLNGNESDYVESAREMFRGGSLIVPTLNGLPYVEKPPLFQWLLLAAFHVGGVSEFAARSVPLIASLALCFALVHFSSILEIGGRPWTAAYVYLTSVGVVLMSAVAMPDVLLNSLFGIGCLAFAAALKTKSRNLTRLTGLSLGLACLAKGFVALLLFALIVAAYVAAKGKDRKLVFDLWRDPLAWILLTAPWLAWIVAAEVSLPGTAWHFVVDEHILRFLGLRQPRDYYSGSILYYVPRIFLFAFPWISVVIFGWTAGRHEETDGRRDTRHFLWACVWVTFVFFSLSQAKANYYVTLCLPPLALLEADYLQVLLRKKKIAWLLQSIVVPSLILIAGVAVYQWAVATGRVEAYGAKDGSVAITTAILVVLCLALVALTQFRWRQAAALGIGVLTLPLIFQLRHIAVTADPWTSSREMAAYIKSKFHDSPLYLYQDYEAYGGLPIYLDRNIPVIDSRSNDLYYGSRVRPADPLLVKAGAVPRTRPALVVVLDGRQNAFQRTALASRAEVVRKIGKATLYRLTAGKS